MTEAQKQLCYFLEAPSYTSDDYQIMVEAANEIRYLAARVEEFERRAKDQ